MALAHSVLLGAAVFTVAALAGALLSGTAVAEMTVELPSERAAPDSAADGSPARHPVDPIFAQSLIYSGTAALTVSAAGLVMVGRRRRLW